MIYLHLTQLNNCIEKDWLYYKMLGKRWTFVHSWWECKMIKSLWKKFGIFFLVLAFLKKIYVHLPNDPAIPLLEIYSRTLKNIEVHVHKKVWTWIFIVDGVMLNRSCMTPPIRTRPNFPDSQSLPTGSSISLLSSQRADKMKITITEN